MFFFFFSSFSTYELLCPYGFGFGMHLKYRRFGTTGKGYCSMNLLEDVLEHSFLLANMGFTRPGGKAKERRKERKKGGEKKKVARGGATVKHYLFCSAS